MNAGVDERFQGANTIEAGRLSPYWGEHVARYVFALSFIKNSNVLDIACGTGYGIGFLKQQGSFITGVDINIEAALEAKKECGAKAGVLLGDGLGLPFANETFDVITSFETLEHLQKRANFLSELNRVLRQKGLLILSTPNANYTKPVNGRPSNPFHIHEYTPDELDRELRNDFSVEKFLGQALNPNFGISPFYDAQQNLPKNFTTQARLSLWRAANRLPISLREMFSETLWKRPFYPTHKDYIFSNKMVSTAPVLIAVCRKK